MSESAAAALQYLRDYSFASVVIALAAGFTASKTVVLGKSWHPVLYVIVGAAGTFVAQVALFHFGFREVLDEVTGFRYFFDFVAAYIGSFILTALVHFIKPQ